MDQPDETQFVALSRLDTRFKEMRLCQPEQVAAVRRSIERHGLLHPLVVNRSDDELCVLDGFKRLSVLTEQDAHEVLVRFVDLSKEQAMAALITFNAPHRGLSDLEEAWVVAALVRDHGLRQIDVAELLGRHKSWVCRRLSLAERLEDGVVEDMRLGLIAATAARELARLPRGNQLDVANAVHQHGLTTRQTASMVSRLLECDDEEARSGLITDPLRYLAERPEPPDEDLDPRLSEAGNRVRKRLLVLQRAADVAGQELRWQNRAGLTPDDVAILAALTVSMREMLLQICEDIGQWTAVADQYVSA